MSRRQHIADHTHTSYGDPVRREAYERAMETLRGRPGLRRNADVSVIRDYRGPVVVGDHADLPSRRASPRAICYTCLYDRPPLDLADPDRRQDDADSVLPLNGLCP